jgi:hypothetical protein
MLEPFFRSLGQPGQEMILGLHSSVKIAEDFYSWIRILSSTLW